MAWVAGGEKILDIFEIKLKESIQKLPFAKILTLKNVQVRPACLAPACLHVCA